MMRQYCDILCCVKMNKPGSDGGWLSRLLWSPSLLLCNLFAFRQPAVIMTRAPTTSYSDATAKDCFNEAIFKADGTSILTPTCAALQDATLGSRSSSHVTQHGKRGTASKSFTY
mmetsp:Transcript_33301/g.64558  ORF Transcript_33301/g.64558 Transcript_33301/m.64558 type:complete len:114 (+) Transcript_33301:187-528(+)